MVTTKCSVGGLFSLGMFSLTFLVATEQMQGVGMCAPWQLGLGRAVEWLQDIPP